MNIIDRIDNYLNNNIDINKRIDNYLANYKEDSTKNQNRTNNVSSKKKDKKIYTFNHALSVMNPQNEEPNQSKKREQIYGFQNNNLFKNTNKMNFNTDTKSSISNEQLKEIEKMNKKLNNSGINQQINFAKIGDKAENTNKYTKNIQAIMKSNKEYDNKKAKKEVATQFAVTPILVLKGAAKDVEGKIDTMIDLSDKINNKLLNVTGNISNKEYDRRREKTRRFIADNRVENLANEYGINKILNTGEKYSLTKRDNLLGKTAEGVGGMLPTIAISRLAKIPKFTAKTLKGLTLGGKLLTLGKNIGTHMLVNSPTTASFSSKVYGGALEEAYAEGATDEQARNYAIASTAVEIASEWITGGVPGTNGAGGIDIFVDKGIDKITNQLTKSLVKYGYNVIGEGAEEILSEILNPIIKNATYSSGNTINWDDVVESFIVGGLTAGVLELPNSYMNYKQNKVYENYDEVVNQLKETKKNISDNETKTKIDNLINEINNAKTSDTDTDINKMNAKINDYINLRKQQSLNKEQKKDISKLEQKLNELQNIKNNQNVDVRDNQNEINLPTVQDIVNQEKLSQSGINLPVYNQQSNISNSDKAILPTVNDFSSSNINMPTSDIKVDMAKISPEILNDIKGFKLGDPSIESYKGSYIKTMLNEVGIKVPTAMNYVSEVRPDMSFTTTKDLTRQQYVSIGNALQKLKSVDITGVNNINEITANNILPVNVSQINQIKGNIPINQELLNKYNNVSEMINKNINKYDGKVDVESSIAELNNIDLNSMSQNELSNLATNIFEKYNSSNTFINDGNKIMVTRSGIKESINKILYNKNQKKYLKEHLQVFSDLGDIIESATLASQTTEGKSRENNKIWNYYLNGLNINDNNYLFEFDVVSRQNGENHYRVQRLEKINSKKANASVENTITSVTPTLETSAFSNNNIPQSNNNVNNGILPTINNMQNSEKNTNKILNPSEISKLTKEDANTTPILPKRGSANKANDGNSHFAKNIKEKVNMLNVEQKAEILSKEDVRYYDKVTNKESLEKAFKKINDGGSSETLRWVKQDSKNANATDVAEGWILLKQYADNGDYDSMVEVAKKMREIGTTAGQTVQAFNIMERMTPEGMVKYAQSELSEAYDRMVKNKSKEWIDKYREDFDLKPDEVKFIMDTMQKVQNMEDGYDKRVKLAEIQKLMTDKLPPEKGAKIKSWMRISMLFNPKTQVRNVAGNALIMPINSFGDLFSSYADKLIAKKTGVRTTGTTNIKAMLKGIKKGAYEATNDYKKGINTKDMEGNRFEISDGKSFSEKNLMGRALNRTESLLNYVMDVGDRIFSEAAFENSLQNQMVLNNTNEITQEMIDIAHQEALSRTWNDNNNYTRFVLNARAGLNKLANFKGYGLGDVLIPFAKTPANLTKAIVDYSPAGLISAINKGVNLKKSLTNGQYTAKMQHEFVQSLGKATAGTMLYVLGIALAKAGISSGDSDDDKDTANFLKNTLGVSSYSIKIGNKSFAYDWAQPIAAPLSITANIVNKRYQNKDSKELLSLIIDSLDTGGSILLEQSFLQSINDVLTDNNGIASGIIKEVLELPARAVPTFSKQIADLIDGTQRTTFEYGNPLKSASNSIVAKIPILSKTLSPSVDTMGREIEKYGGKNNLFNVFLNPANVSTENISESAEEIYRLYKETGETNIMPRVAPYYINQKGEKITMTGEERTKYQKISGMIIEDSVNKLLKNNDYQQLNNTEKADIINKIVNYSYNKAREEVLGIEMSNEYNKINSYVDDGGNVADYYLNKKEIDYSYSNPGKYKTITQITSYNDYLSYKENIDTIKEKFTNSSQRKAAVIKYVNSLDLTIPQKAMLIKMNYTSYSNYNNQIINYINEQDISIDEKKEILEELGFKVRNGRVYTK